MRDAIIMMVVTYTNDSIITQYQHITSDSRNSLTIDTSDSLRIKNIRGYFLMLKGQQPSSTFKMLIINNIQLVRMHVQQQESAQPKDSLQQSDPIRTIGGEPVSPEEASSNPPAPPTRTPEDARRERGIPDRPDKL